MYQIRSLEPGEIALLNQIDMGYESDFGYEITSERRDNGWHFVLQRVKLDPPFSRDYDWDWSLEDETIENAKAGLVWIAEHDKRVLAMIEGSQVSESDLEIMSLYISRPYRRRGIGRQLVSALAEVGKQRGMNRLLVKTQATAGPAVDFYLSQGFELIGLNCYPFSATDLEHGESILLFHRIL